MTWRAYIICPYDLAAFLAPTCEARAAAAAAGGKEEAPVVSVQGLLRDWELGRLDRTSTVETSKQCSPRHPPHSVPVLAASSAT